MTMRLLRSLSGRPIHVCGLVATAAGVRLSRSALTDGDWRLLEGDGRVEVVDVDPAPTPSQPRPRPKKARPAPRGRRAR